MSLKDDRMMVVKEAFKEGYEKGYDEGYADAIQMINDVSLFEDCLHEHTTILNEEGYAGLFCCDCGEKLADDV